MSQWIPEGKVPEEIRLVNEFLNTLDLERFGEHAARPDEERDELRAPEGLKRWLVERGLLRDEEPVSEDDRELAVAVRDALRGAAEANRGEGWALGEVNQVFGELPLVARIGEGGRPGLEPGGEGVRGALGRIVADVVVASARGTWARLKVCGAEDCRWAYYDHSRSRTGRWCSMEVCGNRVKTRRYRRRRATGG
jgi:predicted RNA-binding Zn ribbon-like protein